MLPENLKMSSDAGSLCGRVARSFSIAGIALLATSAAGNAQDFNAASPNAQGQKPAFENQTRAPVLPDTPLQQQTIAEGLENPWGMAELPDGSWLVTEKPGRLRLIGADGSMSEPIEGLPEVDSREQGGLLDVAISDDFAQTRQIWWSFSHPYDGCKTATAVGTGILSGDGTRVEDPQVIWEQTPPWPSTMHYGSRLVFDGQGGLFVTTGERSVIEARPLAQNVTTTLGKVVRVNPQNGEPMGQPGVDEALPEIWSWGHRNMQGAALGPGGLWTIEHGPKGGDELNHPQAGRNYGWPTVTYGVEYSGATIGEGLTQGEGFEQPVYYWDPVIAPGGMSFYDGEMFPDWQGDLLIGGMQASALVRLELSEGQVTGEARHLIGVGRVRDVEVASDGAIMLLIDDANGQMIRVTPGA